MANKIITKQVELTAVPKTFEKDGQVYEYYQYYVTCGEYTVRVSPDKHDYTGKQIIKNYLSK